MSWTDADIAPASPAWTDADIAPQPAQKHNLLQRVGDFTQRNIITPLRNAAETAIEVPLSLGANVGLGLVGNVAGAGKELLTGDFGHGTAEKLASEIQGYAYQPRNPMARALLEKGGHLLDESKLAGFPMVGTEAQALASGIPAATRLVGSAVENTGNAVKSAAEATGSATQTGAQRLMVNALKPTPLQLTSGEAEIAARELLKRGINPNTSGVVKLKSQIKDLNQRVNNIIDDSTGSVSQQEVGRAVEGTRNKFINQVDPTADLNAISGVAERFAEHPAIENGTIPVRQAQNIKQGTYKVLEGKYGEVGSAETEAQKALARGLREGIEKVAPDVIPLNKELSALFDTLNVTERKAAMELIKDPVQSAAMLHNPAAAAALTANRSSMFKAVVAQVLDSAGKAIRPNKAAIKKPSLSLAPNEPFQPQGMTGQTFGSGPKENPLLTMGDDGPITPPRAQRQMPVVDIPIEPRLNPLYQRGGIPTPPELPKANNPAATYPDGIPFVNEGLPEILRGEVPPKSPLPAIPDQLLPLSEQYPQGIPIGAAEGRMPQPSTPLPKIYPEPRPTMELAEPQATAKALREYPATVDSPLKTEVLQQPEIVKAVDDFRLQAQQLQEAIASETNGFKKSQLEATLRGVENRFAKGMHLLGGEKPADFYGPVYNRGTRFGVNKTFDPKDLAAQLRSK